jgi:hypothetical protein
MNMSAIWDVQTINALSPAHVSAYLRANGWEDQGAYGAFGRLFRRYVGSEGKEILLPTRSSIVDFARRMTELVTDLAVAEGRSTGAVLFDLTLAPFDVVRVRSKDADDYGSVRFAEGLQLHEEARNVLIAAARAATADVPRKAWKGRRPEAINEYLDRVRLGQTEKNSFSVTILSPYSFDPVDQPQGALFSHEAFGRRVTRQFGRALSAIETALAEAVSNPVPAFEKTVEAGVSADLCQSLAKLADNDVGAEVSVSWSPAKPVSQPIRLALSRQDAAVLQEVARAFAREEPELGAQVQGVITRIAEDPKTFDGSATIEALVEGRLRRVHIAGFEESERDLLIDAFRKRKRIQVEGELTLEANRLKLGNPRGLVVSEAQDVNE